jgi:hypothetical protein
MGRGLVRVGFTPTANNGLATSHDQVRAFDYALSRMTTARRGARRLLLVALALLACLALSDAKKKKRDLVAEYEKLKQQQAEAKKEVRSLAPPRFPNVRVSALSAFLKCQQGAAGASAIFCVCRPLWVIYFPLCCSSSSSSSRPCQIRRRKTPMTRTRRTCPTATIRCFTPAHPLPLSSAPLGSRMSLETVSKTVRSHLLPWVVLKTSSKCARACVVARGQPYERGRARDRARYLQRQTETARAAATVRLTNDARASWQLHDAARDGDMVSNICNC